MYTPFRTVLPSLSTRTGYRLTLGLYFSCKEDPNRVGVEKDTGRDCRVSGTRGGPGSISTTGKNIVVLGSEGVVFMGYRG